MVGIPSNAIRPSRLQATPAMRNALKKRSKKVNSYGRTGGKAKISGSEVES